MLVNSFNQNLYNNNQKQPGFGLSTALIEKAANKAQAQANNLGRQASKIIRRKPEEGFDLLMEKLKKGDQAYRLKKALPNKETGSVSVVKRVKDWLSSLIK